MWKVRNGETINARRNLWILGLNTGAITSNISYESNVQIREFITNQMEWDAEKINDICLPFEAKDIMNVYIAGLNAQDKRYWRFKKKGSYSVKTGYYSHIKYQVNEEDNCKNISSSYKDSLWSTIWGLKIPPKIRIFVWKMALDIIAA